MPEYRKALDARQGQDFQPTRRTPFGVVTRLAVGGVELAADVTSKDPARPDADRTVVAVLTEVLWETGVTDAVYFTGLVSPANRQAITALIYTDLTRVDAAFGFAVYEFDLADKRYFTAFHGADLAGVLEKNGADLNLSVADDPDADAPDRYLLQVGIKPVPLAQQLRVATDAHREIVKAWGLTVG